MKKLDLKNFKLPDAPGVYFFKDGKGKILYIGKATNLKDRVTSYFGKDIINTRGVHILDMVTRAENIEWEETGSVLEAIILEVNAIKKWKPYYNTKEKDDKSFNTIVITKEKFPRVLTIRQKDLDIKNKTFSFAKYKIKDQKFISVYGPYPSSGSLREVLKIIRRIFPFDDRSSRISSQSVFWRQIGLAPDTTSENAVKIYSKSIKNIEMILGGKMRSLVSSLKKEMDVLAKREKFEEAKVLRDKIFALEHIRDVSLLRRDDWNENTVSNMFRIEAYDIAHMSGQNMVGVMVASLGGKIENSEHRKFIIKSVSGSNDQASLSETLSRRLNHPEWPLPNLIVVDGNETNRKVALSVLKEKNLLIDVVSVVKDDRHKAKAIIGNKTLVDKYSVEIIKINAEAHRFAIRYHREKRNKAFLG